MIPGFCRFRELVVCIIATIGLRSYSISKLLDWLALIFNFAFLEFRESSIPKTVSHGWCSCREAPMGTSRLRLISKFSLCTSAMCSTNSALSVLARHRWSRPGLKPER